MRTSSTRLHCLALGLSLGLATTLGGCGLCGDVVCGACPAALTLQIKDSVTGGPVPDVVVSGAQAYCDDSAGADQTSCDVTLGAGPAELVLSAPGYDDQTISVTINADSGESCCSCGYNQKVKGVVMTPQA